MLIAETNNIDLGRIQFGKPHTFQIPVTNKGGKTISITKVAVGCTSCTKAHIAGNRMDPGQTKNVNVTFTPGTLGPQKKSIIVYWDTTSILKLEFTAQSYEQS